MQTPSLSNLSNFRLLFLDFETYYDADYSLRKMPTPNYILDDRWETIMCSVAEGKEKARIIDGPDFEKFIAGYDPATTATVTFNSLFDNSILAWRYGFVPHLMFDAMGMARALRGHILSGASLEVVAKTLKVGQKLHTVHDVKGMRRQDIVYNGLWPAYCDYCRQDTDLMSGIFWQLLPEFPRSEWRVMDLVIRCAVEPRFMLDTDLLRRHLATTRANKETLLQQAGVQKDDLMSTAKFTKMLQDRGITVELKQSPTLNKDGTPRMIPAFAKTDSFMEELCADSDPVVAAMAAARLGHKSTLEETRCEKLLSIAELPWHKCKLPIVQQQVQAGQTNINLIPIPLRYGAAHTHRLAGDWGMNMQNMPRGSNLRKAIMSMPGYSVITADLAQIEARLVAWICQALALLKNFRDYDQKLGPDPYSIFATAVFGFVVDKDLHPVHRFIGKTGVLGLGYGCGAEHFFEMVGKLARAMKVDLTAVNFTEQLALTTVRTYRNINNTIPRGWKTLDGLLQASWLMGAPGNFGPLTFSHGQVMGPNGLAMRYLPARTADGELGYRHGKKVAKMYGAKMMENLIQFLARIIIMNVALRLEGRGLRFALQAHDELVFIVRDEDVITAKAIIHQEMTRAPSWARDLPLEASVGVGKSYGAAK